MLVLSPSVIPQLKRRTVSKQVRLLFSLSLHPSFLYFPFGLVIFFRAVLGSHLFPSLPFFEPSQALVRNYPLLRRFRLAFLPLFANPLHVLFSSHFRNCLLISSGNARFSLISVIETEKMHDFLKIFPEKFCQFGKKQYLCTRFRKNGGSHRLEVSDKKEFFDKIYINRKQQYKKQVRDHLGKNEPINSPSGMRVMR